MKQNTKSPDITTAKREGATSFTISQKEEILKRDGYQCVIGGFGVKEGVDLHVDHIEPQDLGGKSTINNGQTLCSQHNFLKKNLLQTEAGKKMFIRLHERAKQSGDTAVLNFCIDILKTYESHNINGHIKWEK